MTGVYGTNLSDKERQFHGRYVAPSRFFPIDVAPINRRLELQVDDGRGPYVLPFPCMLTAAGWINARNGSLLQVAAIGWRAKDW